MAEHAPTLTDKQENRHKELVTRHQQPMTLQMLEQQAIFTRRQIRQVIMQATMAPGLTAGQQARLRHLLG